MALPALIWALQLHLIELFSTVLFRIGEFRTVWLTSNGYLSYYWANVAIAGCLLAMALLVLVRALQEKASKLEIGLAIATLLFVGGFGFRLVFLGSHHLSADWYAQAVADEPLDARRWFLAVVHTDPRVSPAMVTVETCEKVALELPTSGTPSRVVAIEEKVGRFSGERSLHAPFFLEYDDLCTFLRGYARSQPGAGCLTRRCS